MNLQEIAKAYQSIYLKEEVVEEEFGIEDLSQEELDLVAEEAIESLLEEGFTIEEIEEALEEDIEDDFFSEARMTDKQKEMRAKFKAQQAAHDAQITKGVEAKKAEDARKAKAEARKERVEKVKASVKSGISKVKEKATEAGESVKRTTNQAKGAVAKAALKATGTELKGKKGQTLNSSQIHTQHKSVRDKAKAAIVANVKGKVKQKVRDVVDPQIGKYAAKRGLGGPGPGLKLRSNDPETRRSVRGEVAADIKQRVASKPGRVAAAAGEKVKEVKKGVKRSARGALLNLARRLKEEGGELDTFDLVAAYMIDEGFASDFGGATALMAKLSSELVDDICESQLQLLDEASVYGARKGTIRAVIEKGGKSIKYVPSGGDILAGDRAAQERANAAAKKRSGKDKVNAARAEQARKKSIKNLNSKPGEDSGDYNDGDYGDDDTSNGKRHYSLSHTNRAARKRRESGR